MSLELAEPPRIGDGEVARGGPVDVPRLSRPERDRRWARVRELMDRDALDVIVGVANTHMFDQFQASVRYLTSLGGNCATKWTPSVRGIITSTRPSAARLRLRRPGAT